MFVTGSKSVLLYADLAGWGDKSLLPLEETKLYAEKKKEQTLRDN